MPRRRPFSTLRADSTVDLRATTSLEATAERKEILLSGYSPSWAAGGSYFGGYNAVTSMPGRSWSLHRAVKEGLSRDVYIYRAVKTIALDQSRLRFGIRQGDLLSPNWQMGPELTDDPLLKILNVRANNVELAYQLRERVSMIWMLSPRGGFIEKEQTKGGKVTAVKLLPTMRTHVEPAKNGDIQRFRVDSPLGQGPPRYLDPDQVVWFREPHPDDPYAGLTALEAASLDIEVDYFARLFNRSFLANDGRPGGIVAVTGPEGTKGQAADEDELERVERRLGGGPVDAGRFVVIDGTVQFVDTSGTPRDAQWQQARQASKLNELGALGVPESVALMNATNSTFANSGQEWTNYWIHTQCPHADAFALLWLDVVKAGVPFLDYSKVEALQGPVQARRAELRDETQQGLRTPKSYAVATGQKVGNGPDDDMPDVPATRSLWLAGAGKVPVAPDAEDQLAVDKLAPLGSGTQGAPLQEGAAGGDQGGDQGGGGGGGGGSDPWSGLPDEFGGGNAGNGAGAYDANLKAIVAARVAQRRRNGMAALVGAARRGMREPDDEEDHRAARCETDLRRALTKTVNGLVADTLRAVTTVRARAGTRHAPGGGASTKQLDPADVVDPQEWEDRVATATAPYLAAAASSQRQQTAQQVEADSGDDLEHVAVGSLVGGVVGAAAVSVPGLTAAQVARLPLDVLGDLPHVVAFLAGSARARAEDLAAAIAEAENEDAARVAGGGAPAGPAGVTRAVREWATGLRGWVDRVAPDSAQQAVEAGKHAVLGRLGDRVERWWLSKRDEKVRPTHKAADGQVQTAGTPFVVGGALLRYPRDPLGPPGETINCFPADAPVLADDVVGGYRRWYEGRLVQVELASGNVLAATPNHPVLTERGWVPVGELEEGDYLVRAGGADGLAERPDVQDAPPCIEQVVQALAGIGTVERVPGVAVDFHGDGTDGQVDVVRPLGELRHGDDAATVEHPGKFGLTDADVRDPVLPGAGSQAPPLEGINVTPASDVRRTDKSSPLDGIGAGHSDGHRGTTPAWLEAALKKDAPEGAAANPEAARDRLLRLAGEVSTDRIVGVREDEWRGHVYNLETRSGIYGAYGVVAGNCRCQTRWRLRGEQKRLELGPFDVVAAVLEVKAKRVRHVRTPEGSRYYKLPIGSPITARTVTRAARDAADAARAVGRVDHVAEIVAAREPHLTTTDYEGTVGREDHITRIQQGTVPTSAIADLLGVKGEKPGEHRNRQDARWTEFLDSVRANGITHPIFITVDPGQEPRISEGNHRRDAAVELGLPTVPVEVRYFGHAEREHPLGAPPWQTAATRPASGLLPEDDADQIAALAMGDDDPLGAVVPLLLGGLPGRDEHGAATATVEPDVAKDPRLDNPRLVVEDERVAAKKEVARLLADRLAGIGDAELLTAGRFGGDDGTSGRALRGMLLDPGNVWSWDYTKGRWTVQTDPTPGERDAVASGDPDQMHKVGLGLSMFKEGEGYIWPRLGGPAMVRAAREQAISDLVGVWAATSNDSHSRALAMQRAVAEEFGIPEAPWDEAAIGYGRGDVLRDAAAEYDTHGPTLRAFARAQYDLTQERLKAAGVDSLRLYRGVHLWSEQGVPEWARSAVGHDVDVPLRPASAFSADPQTAIDFASNGMSDQRVVLVGDVPRERILGTPRSGVGCLNEWEFVVLAGPGKFSVYGTGDIVNAPPPREPLTEDELRSGPAALIQNDVELEAAVALADTQERRVELMNRAEQIGVYSAIPPGWWSTHPDNLTAQEAQSISWQETQEAAAMPTSALTTARKFAAAIVAEHAKPPVQWDKTRILELMVLAKRFEVEGLDLSEWDKWLEDKALQVAPSWPASAATVNEDWLKTLPGAWDVRDGAGALVGSLDRLAAVLRLTTAQAAAWMLRMPAGAPAPDGLRGDAVAVLLAGPPPGQLEVKAKVRRVRTEEGARLFREPIGAPIVYHPRGHHPRDAARAIADAASRRGRRDHVAEVVAGDRRERLPAGLANRVAAVRAEYGWKPEETGGWPAQAVDYYADDNEFMVLDNHGVEHYGAHGAAGALLRNVDEDGTVRYLLQRRSAMVQHGGTWSTPGGALHAGETPAAGAAREVGEELGVDPSSLRHVATHTDDRGGWAYHTVVLDAPDRDAIAGTADASGAWESDGVGWFTADEIAELNLHPGFAASWATVRDGKRKPAPVGGLPAAYDAMMHLFDEPSRPGTVDAAGAARHAANTALAAMDPYESVAGMECHDAVIGAWRWLEDHGITPTAIRTTGAHSWVEASIGGEAHVVDVVAPNQTHLGAPVKLAVDATDPLYRAPNVRTYGSLEAYAKGEASQINLDPDANGTTFNDAADQLAAALDEQAPGALDALAAIAADVADPAGAPGDTAKAKADLAAQHKTTLDLIDAGMDPEKAAKEYARLLNNLRDKYRRDRVKAAKAAATAEGKAVTADKADDGPKGDLADVGDALLKNDAVDLDKALAGVADTAGHPKALYDAHGSLGPGAAKPGGKAWFDLFSDDATEPVPVVGLTIEGYTVQHGWAVPVAGRAYLVETAGPLPVDDPMVAMRLENAKQVYAAVMAGLPQAAAHQHRQRGVAMLLGKNPKDAYWAEQYDTPGFTSGATGGNGGTTFWASTTPTPGLVAHEFGHNLDRTLFWSGAVSSASKPTLHGQTRTWAEATADDARTQVAWRPFTKGPLSERFVETRRGVDHPITVGHDEPTGYAANAPTEDFAESVRLYLKDRHDGKLGYVQPKPLGTGAVGTNVRFADLWPERARILDAAFGTVSDYDTAFHKQQVKAATEAVAKDPGSFTAVNEVMEKFGLDRAGASASLDEGSKQWAAAAKEQAKQDAYDSLLAQWSELSAVPDDATAAAAAFQLQNVAGLSHEDANLVVGNVVATLVAAHDAKQQAAENAQAAQDVKDAEAQLANTASLPESVLKRIRHSRTDVKSRAKKNGASPEEAEAIAAAWEAKALAKAFAKAGLSGQVFTDKPKKGKATGQTVVAVQAVVDPKWDEAAHKRAEAWLNGAGTSVAPHAAQQTSYGGSVNLASQAKANLCATLASMLNNEEDWETFRAYKASGAGVGYHSYDFSGKADLPAFADTTAETRQAALDAECSSRIQNWAATSADANPFAIMMQRAAAEEFGLTGGHGGGKGGKMKEVVDARYPQLEHFYKRFLRVMYDNTQAELQAANLEWVPLYRGMRLKPLASGGRKWATKGVHEVPLRALSSFAAAQQTARNFASGRMLMRGMVHRTHIIGTARTGFGCRSEFEFVVMAPPKGGALWQVTQLGTAHYYNSAIDPDFPDEAEVEAAKHHGG